MTVVTNFSLFFNNKICLIIFFELRFIYCGNIELKNLQGSDVLKLLIAVDELNIQQLISHIQEFLIEHQTEFLHKNPIGILETVYQHETFTDLWNFCLEKICEEPKILFSSDKFINLKTPLLELLLKRDDLNIDEIEIFFNGCIKFHNYFWQTPIIPHSYCVKMCNVTIIIKHWQCHECF